MFSNPYGKYPVAQVSSRRIEQARRKRQGIVMIAGCGVVLAAMIGGVVWSMKGSRDSVSGCLKSHKAGVRHVALSDRTDRLKPVEQDLLVSGLQSLAAQIATEDRLTVVAFDGNADVPAKPLFDRCRPSDGNDVSPWFSTPARAEKRFRDGFQVPLDAALKQAAEGGSARETHLVAFLGGLAASLKYQAKAESVVIHVFSDMAENTPAGSFLPGKKSKPFDAAGFTMYVRQLTGGRLAGVEIKVHALSTSGGAAAGKRIKEAWSEALTANGVRFNWGSL